MADLHPEKCFCAGTGFITVNDPRDSERYVEVSCPGEGKAKRRHPNAPKNRLAFTLPAHEFVLSETDVAGKSVQISHVTDGSPVATIRLWSWDLESKEWIVMHDHTCHLSAEETYRLGTILWQKASKSA